MRGSALRLSPIQCRGPRAGIALRCASGSILVLLISRWRYNSVYRGNLYANFEPPGGLVVRSGVGL